MNSAGITQPGTQVRGAHRGTHGYTGEHRWGGLQRGGVCLQRGGEGPRSARGHFAESLGNFVACSSHMVGLLVSYGRG